MNLPKSKKNFIERFNDFLQDWEFIGTNPFSESNRNNERLMNSLQLFAEELGFDDPSDLYNLQEFFEELED